MKKIVYHYCSLETFMNIAQNKTIWLSHSRNTNDKTECLYALQNIVSVLKKYNSTEKNDELINEIIRETESITDFPYIFCCSKDKDLLSQWSKYGDNGKGIAIGFDINCIPHINMLGEGNFTNNLIIDEVNYNMKGFDEIIIKSAQTLPLLKEKGLSDKIIKESIIDFYKMLSIFIKNKGFKEEKEVRFVLKANYTHILRALNKKSQTKEHKEQPKILFRAKNNNIISYFELKFDEKAITEIIIGPKCNVDFNQLTLFLSEYLPQVGRKNKIFKSNIPYT